MAEKKTDSSFVQTAFQLAVKGEIARLLFISDIDAPPEEMRKRGLKGKLIRVVTGESRARQIREAGGEAMVVPDYNFGRMDRIKVALAGVINAGMVKDGDRVLCVTGRDPVSPPDTALQIVIGEEFEERATLKMLGAQAQVPSQVVEIVLKLATSIGHEGFEGFPVGTILTVGDSVAVMEKSKQITLNPFQGYPEAERNIVDPNVTEAVKVFAFVDGAFVIREDGIVLSAGRYLQADGSKVNLPLGLGARHTAAAAISAETKALVFVVSQTTGTVRVFQKGEVALEVRQSRRRG